MLHDLRNLITLRTDERGRYLRRTALPLLAGLLALGLLAGTASARLGSVSAGATTTEETTTTAGTTTDDNGTTETTTTDETTPVTTVTTVQVTTTEATTTTGVGAGGAAVVGAAAAQSQEESSTQWGWIAFGILAAIVVVFGIVWLIRRPRHA